MSKNRDAQHAALRDTTRDRIAEMKQSEVERVAVLDSGTGEDCPACTRIASEESYAIEEVPEIPPASCTCSPWCRLVVIAAD